MKKTLFIVLITVLVGFCFAQGVLASTTDGTVSGYGWGNRLGWINFGCANCNIHVTDAGLTGWAWSENFGWIKLDPAQSGVDNTTAGVLSGRAFGEQIGWINFSGVTITDTGVFEGSASVDQGGTITFDCANCNVATDWRPTSDAGSGGSGGGGGGGGSPGGGGGTYPAPSGPFSVRINSGAFYTNNPAVILSIETGPSVAYYMELSNNANFVGAIKESYKPTKAWTLSTGDGQKTVYARFYTQYGTASDAVIGTITLDTQAPEVKITSIKNSYTSNEAVVIAGTTEPNALIAMVIDNEYGTFLANTFGSWNISVGTRGVGSHHVSFIATDAAGNVGTAAQADFAVQASLLPPVISDLLPQLGKPLEPILHTLEQGIISLLPEIFHPLQKPEPEAVVTIPLNAPIAFTGKFHYLSTQALGQLVLTPLPQDIKQLAVKLPQIQRLFNQVGINKLTDLQKLQNADLTLPNLTETVLPNVALAPGKFAIPKGIPVAKLTTEAKTKIPSAVVFAKAAGGLVDYNVALSVNEKGKTQQTIQAVAGQPLQLVVKADAGVKKVKGYIIFKSKKPAQPSSKVPLNNLAASLLFSNPNMAEQVTANKAVPIEGSQIAAVTASAKEVTDIAGIEQRLVLDTFEYSDSGDGIYVADVNVPVVDGEYEIITVMDYGDSPGSEQEIKLVTVVDPEGYIYEKSGDKETRIAGAIASLYWLNPDTKQYELWPAAEFQQENPQTTDVRGTYSFLVPNGYYYIKVDAPGYLSYDGKPFEVKEGGGVHINIELKTRYWWLQIADWKTVILVIVIFMLLYNFYRDRVRDRQVDSTKK